MVSTFDQLESVIDSIIAVTNCERTSLFVKQHFDKLKHISDNPDLNCSCNSPVGASERNLTYEDFLDASKYVDEKQELNSLFYSYFQKKLDNFQQSKIYANHKFDQNVDGDCKNVYFDKIFCQKLIRNIISRICCTSRLLIGDLSRHANTDTLYKTQKLYDDYSLKYKQLEKLESNLVCDRNLTQGIIEQHFSSLKNVYLKGNRIGRLDTFVEQYYSELKITQKLFSDHALRSCLSSNKSRKPNRLKCNTVVASKFKKRKRRQTGYYSSQFAKRRIRFIGEHDNTQTWNALQNNIYENDVESISKKDCLIVTTLNNEKNNLTLAFEGDLRHSKVIKYGNEFDKLNIFAESETTKKFSHLVWSSFSESIDICDVALTFDATHSLSWLDLSTVNSEPDSIVFQEIVTRFPGSCKGWLSKYVIDNYLNILVEKFNFEIESQKFGSLDCNDSACILQNKVKNISIFNSRLLIDDSNQIRPHILIPILIQNHFILLWYSHSVRTLVLIDSIDHNWMKVVSNIKQVFLNFFYSLSCADNFQTITFEAKNPIIQPDNSSCGVCLCMAADMICRTNTLTAHIKLDKRTISDYRNWIIYFLFVNCISCSVHLVKPANDILKDIIVGLPNIANNCWFNSVVQAVVSVIQTYGKFTTYFNLKHLDNGKLLIKVIKGLLKKQNISHEELRNVLRSVSNKCRFVFGEQQDPVEFFEVSDLAIVLHLNSYSSYLQLEKHYTCNQCKHVFIEKLAEQSIFKLPIGEKAEKNCSLSMHMQTFLCSSEIKQCRNCQSISDHETNISFAVFPDGLVVSIQRNVSSKKSKETVFLSNTLQLSQKSSKKILNYKLVSVVVHSGDFTNCGHFSCCILKDDCIIELNDQKINKIRSSEKTILLERNGYMFFYVKQAEYCSNHSSSSSDFDDHNYCSRKKKVIKRRKKVQCDTVVQVKALIERQLIEYIPTFNTLSYEWEKSNASVIQLVVEKVIHVVCAPIIEAEYKEEFCRHYLFLKGQTKKLFKCNSCLDFNEFDLTAEFMLDFCFCVHKKLCWQVQSVKRFGDHIFSKLSVGTLVFKPSILNETSDLRKYLNLHYSESCNEYLRQVLDIEIMIYYIMVQHDMDYKSASISLKLRTKNFHTFYKNMSN